MIGGVCYLNDARWRVAFRVIESCDDAEGVIDDLADMGCHGDDIIHASAELRRCGVNTGLAYTNANMRNSLIVIGKSDSSAEFVNTLRHEQHHVIMHICSADGLDPYSEDGAYVAGELGMEMYVGMRSNGLL